MVPILVFVSIESASSVAEKLLPIIILEEIPACPAP